MRDMSDAGSNPHRTVVVVVSRMRCQFLRFPGFNHCKKLKAEPSRLIPRKLAANFELWCIHVRVHLTTGPHNLFATAGRITFNFINYGRQWVEDIFSFFNCFC